MKIVFVIDSWNPGNGCIVATHHLVEVLQERGHEISLVTTAGPAAEKFNGKVYTVPGFYLPGVKKAMLSMNFQFGKGVKKTLKAAYRGADLVQIQFPYFMAANSVKVAKKMGIPVLGACHIQSQNMTGAMGKDSKALDLFFNSWFNYELFRRVDAIHCPSAFAADLIKSKGSNAHFRVISNGIPKEFRSYSEMKRPEFFGDNFVILNVGRFAIEKRQEYIIKAVGQSRYKDKIQLILCGKGDDAEKLVREGDKLPIKPKIAYVSEEDKILYLNTADLYLHSSYVELESISCLEAIGCGLPCLVSDSHKSAASQFALNDELIFELDNVEKMAKKIDYWFENRQRLEQVRKQTLEMAEKYRVTRTVTAMEKLYDDVINYTKGQKELLPKREKILG